MTLKTGLIVQGNTALEALVNTGPDWKVYRNPAYAPSVENRQDVGCADIVNASLYPWGWETEDMTTVHGKTPSSWDADSLMEPGQAMTGCCAGAIFL